MWWLALHELRGAAGTVQSTRVPLPRSTHCCTGRSCGLGYIHAEWPALSTWYTQLLPCHMAIVAMQWHGNFQLHHSFVQGRAGNLLLTLQLVEDSLSYTPGELA